MTSTSMFERTDINCAFEAGTGVPEFRTNQPSSLDKNITSLKWVLNYFLQTFRVNLLFCSLPDMKGPAPRP